MAANALVQARIDGEVKEEARRGQLRSFDTVDDHLMAVTAPLTRHF